MKVKHIILMLILIGLTNCSNNLKMKQYNSEYNYSMNLPENWSEYETDEKNANAFFDTTRWTGNLRISTMDYKVKNPKEFLRGTLTENNGKDINWNNINGVYYSENENDEEIHYWYLIENNKFYVCSFIIGNLNGKTEIEEELNRVIEILKSIKSK
jgi:hypothetical protein